MRVPDRPGDERNSSGRAVARTASPLLDGRSLEGSTMPGTSRLALSLVLGVLLLGGCWPDEPARPSYVAPDRLPVPKLPLCPEGATVSPPEMPEGCLTRSELPAAVLPMEFDAVVVGRRDAAFLIEVDGQLYRTTSVLGTAAFLGSLEGRSVTLRGFLRTTADGGHTAEIHGLVARPTGTVALRDVQGRVLRYLGEDDAVVLNGLTATNDFGVSASGNKIIRAGSPLELSRPPKSRGIVDALGGAHARTE